MKPCTLGSGHKIVRVFTRPQPAAAFISLTVYVDEANPTTTATCPSGLYRPPGQYTTIAPIDGRALVATPSALAFVSQSSALPPQDTRRLYAAHQVHCPNGKRFGKPPAGT